MTIGSLTIKNLFTKLPSEARSLLTVSACAALLLTTGCAPDERHDSAFYKICKEKNKSEALAHTVGEILALVSSPASCEQAHNYLMKTSSLTLAGKGISALEPLAGLPKLVELNLAGNKIADLGPLTGLAKLRFLYLENNQLADATALAALPNLAVLNVSHNQLTSLAGFGRFPKLSRLFASHNALESALGRQDDSAGREPDEMATETGDLAPALVKLDISANPDLAALPAELVANVAELNISRTKITSLAPLTANAALTSIIADDIGGIAELGPLAGKPGLAMVGLKNNKIKDIGILAQAKALAHLDISFNEVTSLMPLSASSSLKALFVEGNPIANSKNQTKENCPQGDSVPEPVLAVCQQPAGLFGLSN